MRAKFINESSIESFLTPKSEEDIIKDLKKTSKNELGQNLLYLLQNIENESKIDFNKIKLLLNYDADINITDNDGYTLLHYAVILNNIELVKLLINKGIDLNKKEKIGYSTALDKSKVYGYDNISYLLIQHGAKKSTEL